MSDKRSQILDAAEQAFYAEGFFATGMDRIVRQSGVTRRTLYRHFASKTALVLAVLAAREARYLARLRDDAPEAAAGPTATARHVALRHAEWLLDPAFRGCIFVRAIGEYHAHEAGVRDAVQTHKTRVREQIAQMLRAAGEREPHTAALDLCLALEGATQCALVFPAATVRERLLVQTSRLFPGH